MGFVHYPQIRVSTFSVARFRVVRFFQTVQRGFGYVNASETEWNKRADVGARPRTINDDEPVWPGVRSKRQIQSSGISDATRNLSSFTSDAPKKMNLEPSLGESKQEIRHDAVTFRVASPRRCTHAYPGIPPDSKWLANVTS